MSELTDHTPTLRLRDTGELAELVPYLLGFHPRRSVVWLGLRGRRRQVTVTLRSDLTAETELEAEAMAERCLSYLVRSGAEAVALVVYGDDPPATVAALPHAGLVGRIGVALSIEGVEVIEAALVCAGRWWCYRCPRSRCCAPAGGRISTSEDYSVVTVAATVAGMTAAPDRSAIERAIEPLPPETRVGVAKAIDQVVERFAGEPGRLAGAAVDAWGDAVAGQRGAETALTDEQVALLLVGLARHAVRDRCCDWADGDELPAAAAVCRQLARRAPPGWDATPYALVAWFAWREGDGVLARIAVERALGADPRHRLTQLIGQLLDRGVDPREWA